MNWNTIKKALAALALAAYTSGYITEKAYKQIIAALGNSSAMKGANR